MNSVAVENTSESQYLTLSLGSLQRVNCMLASIGQPSHARMLSTFFLSSCVHRF